MRMNCTSQLFYSNAIKGTIALFFFCTLFFTSWSQTTLIDPAGDGGFENGATPALNNWVAVNSSTDSWIVSTVAGVSAGTNAAYISSTPSGTMTWTYSQVSTIQHMYYDVTIPAGESKVTLSFKWKAGGEGSGTSDWDNMKVFWGLASSINPVANTAIGAGFQVSGPGAVSGMYKLNSASYNSETISLTGVPGQTYRLVFSWKSDFSTIANPPAAIDEVSVISDVPGNFISAMTGDWNVGATWVGGVAPTSSDNATIDAGHTVTINATGLAINNLTINNTGVLEYGSTPSSFSVNGNLTVNAGGTFNVFQGTTGKTLTVAGNITNDGTIDISVGTTTAGNLTLNGNTVQTIGGSGSFNTSVIRNLTCSNTNTSTPNIIWNVNNVKISYNLNLTGARIETNGNKITFGNNAAGNTLTAPIGTGFLPGAKFSRWWTTTATGTSVTAGTDPTNATSRYPFLDASGLNRAIYISRTGSTTGNVAGELAVVYNDAITMTTGLNIVDGAYTITDRYNGNWVVSTEATSYSHAGAHTVVLLGQNAYFASNGNSRVMNASSVAGTHQNGTTTPGAQRTGLTTAQLTAGALYMGINEADIPFQSTASGDWNDPTNWNKGTVPACTDNVTILNGHTITVNSAANVSRNVTINTGGTLVVASGDLTVGCTLNNNTLTNNGTLTVIGGTLNINGNMVHNAGSTFNQSSGDINVDGNANGNAANSVASGVSIVQLNSQNINWTGGTLTIVDPHANSTASNTFAYNNSTAHVNVTSGHTLRFGDGISTDPGGNATNGFRLNTWVGSNRISFYNVIINGGTGTNRYITSQYSFGINGDLTINTDSEFRPGNIVYVNGNVINNGTSTLTSALVMASFLNGSESASANAQSISGSGTFRNSAASPTANLTSLTINNSNVSGVTLDVPLSVSGTLTLTQGFVNTTSTNILRLGTATAAGTLLGGSATAYINGPFARTFAASRTASGTYNQTTLFPVGKSASSAYLPVHIDPTTTSGGPVIFSGEAFTSNSGTGASGVTGLSDNRWEALITSGAGNFTSSNIRLNDAAIVASNKILQAASAAGTYGSIVPVSTFAAGTPNTLTTTGTQILAAAYNGYFAYGNLEDCIAPADQPTAFTVSNLGTTTFTGSFTAASSNPSHYLVVRYPTGGSVTNPSNFTTYTEGNALGAGTVQAVLTSPTVSFNASGLTANTTYDYYVYSYNNVACNGPVYNTTSPLMGMVTTCAATTGTPGTPTASAVTTTSFTATWTASSTPGVNYIVEVANDAGFTSLVSGYNPLNVGMVLTTPVTGLSPNTTYYVRVRAEIGGCFSVNSGTLTVRTECNAENAPTAVQTFVTFTGAAPAPDCWKEATGTLAPSSTLSGTISAWLLKPNGFANITSTNPGVSINLYSTKNDWFISQPIDLGAIPSQYRVSFNMAVTNWNGTASQSTLGTHRVDIVVSTDGGATWSNSNVIKTYTGAGTYSNTGQIETIDLIGYSGVIKIAFVATTTSTSPDIDFHIDDFKVEAIPMETIDWGNLQWPPSGSIYPGQSYDTYGRAYKAGATEAAGQAPGLNAWIGYSNSNTDPAGWTNWIPATFNVQAGNDDEFIGTFPANTFTPGTYYYAYRYQYNGGPFRYGGYNGTGGGFWDGTNNVSGVLTVNPCPSFTPAASPMSICTGSSSNLTVSSGHVGYSYAWNPGSFSGAGPHTVFPSSTTIYTVTATDVSISCANTATVTVTVNPVPSAVNVTPADAIICPGGGAQLLTANGGQITQSVNVGTGVSTNNTSGITPFTSNWENSRIQYLITAAELSALGIGASNFTSLAFDVSDVGGTGYTQKNYSIKIGATSATDMATGFATTISGFTSVYFIADLPAPVTGLNTFNFSTPFAWDGVNNVLIEICHENDATASCPSCYTGNATVRTTTTAFNSVYGRYQDNAASCGNNTGIAISTFTIRPNMVIVSEQATEKTWASLTGLYTDMAATNAYLGEDTNSVYALPATTTTYTVTAASAAGCTSTANVQVGIEGTIVKNTANSGLHSLRSVYNCIAEGGTITYDQPTTDESILTAPLDITKSVIIQGMSSVMRPEITIPAAGMNIATGKTLTLDNVDVKSSGTATFTGDGTVEIIGTTVGKQ